MLMLNHAICHLYAVVPICHDRKLIVQFCLRILCVFFAIRVIICIVEEGVDVTGL